MKTVLSYLCYYAGDLVSKVVFGTEWGWRGYRVYNRLMIWSSDLDHKKKVWK